MGATSSFSTPSLPRRAGRASVVQERSKRATKAGERPRRIVQVVEWHGSPTRARTWDLRINSPSLYQLSYRGSEEPAILPNYLGNSIGDVVDVLAGERGHADAAGVDGVDRLVLAQAAHLVLGEAAVGKHAAL